MNTSEAIKQSIRSLPNEPGVYKYFNSNSDLIYVGKAKNLKKRVSSYFNKQTGVSLKTIKLVKEIVYIEFVIVNTEYDALILENNLIKQYQPKFNILLKDDKSFPFICISNDRFPKVFSTRKYDKKEGAFFGPYTNVRGLNNILELITKLYTIRTCNLSLSSKNIAENKFKVCLEYHIGNCLGPCEGLQDEVSYNNDISMAKDILKGNLKVVKEHFKEKMNEASEKLNFEAAHSYKTKLTLLDEFKSKTVIFNKSIHSIDVITITSTDQKAFINYMKIENGMINISDTLSVKKKLEESDEDLLMMISIEMRSKFNSNSNIILSNKFFTSWDEQVEVVTPKIGEKKALVALSLKNVLTHKKQSISQNTKQATNNQRVIKKLQQDLQLKELPVHIECFDNSNTQGTNPVASMVCFKNGKPSKKDYRRFKIKTVIGPDDFGSMREIVSRRYKRLIDEKISFPQLVVIDGGKGQLSAACDALKSLDIYNQIPVIGIAKRLEEIYYPEDTIPLHISKKSESLKLIQQLRDEAHRFAITFHRKLRSDGQVKSNIDNISGIGPVNKKKLLSHFKSYEKMKKTTFSELVSLVGNAKAKLIIDYIQKDPSND